MIRPLRLTLGAALILALAACTPAAAQPTWTFPPAGSPVDEAEAEAETAAPATPAPPIETPAPPSAAPEPVASPAVVPGTADAPRVIDVTMGNFFFEPGAISVQAGETIRFVAHNPTTIMHELVIGDAEEQEHHAMEMAEAMAHADGDDHMMAEPNELEVEPGETSELVWTFDEPGEFLLGCHVAGHWEAGMQGAVTVES